MPFPATFDLSTLDGSNGFRLPGVGDTDVTGKSVASIGDINGDGYGDVIIGAALRDTPGFNSGASYVVFGRAGGFDASLEVAELDGKNGFRIAGLPQRAYGGYSVAGAGDVNGDGLADLIVGAFGMAPNGARSGTAYVVFGSTEGFDADLDLTTLDGAGGFKIDGAATGDYVGWSVASAGDVNGDGVDDVIVGAKRAQPNGAQSGAGYVVFGSADPFSAAISLSTLDGTNGFKLSGAAAGDYAGWSVSSAGDVNSDGFDDVLIGARAADNNGANSGAAYVVFGAAAGFAPELQLSSLNGVNGFTIVGAAGGDQAGLSVSSAGDVNGDGHDDLIIGAHRANSSAGAAFVVFGKTGGFGATLNLAGLDGTNGFQIGGAAAGERVGWQVASAGDVNGDGFDDLIVGAPYADKGGTDTGAAYVVFGRAAPFNASLDVTTLNGTNGFVIAGQSPDDHLGYGVGSAGDVNNDGVDDLIVGAWGVDQNATDAGMAYIILGQADRIVFVGTGANDTAGGGLLDDSLSGLGGNDVLSGLAGDDLLDGGAMGDILYGGAGADSLLGGDGGDVLNGEDGDDQIDGGDGADKLNGGLGADVLIGGLGNDRLDGGAGTDTLTGGDGNDLLDGGAGADSLAGGAGNDLYMIGAGDTATEAVDAGYDIVRTDLDGWVLGANFEALELQGAANLNGTGNALGNNLQGNSGQNRLDGAAGVDTINGNDGDDIIIGGLGNDLLRGGLGADAFVVAHAFGSVLETDQIYDFSAAEGDILDLSGAWSGTLAKVDAFSKVAGQMTLTFAGGVTTVRLDTTGDGRPDYQMKINGDVTGETGDWIL